MNGIADIKKTLAVKCSNPNDNAEESNAQIDNVAKQSTSKCKQLIFVVSTF